MEEVDGVKKDIKLLSLIVRMTMTLCIGYIDVDGEEMEEERK